MWKQSVAKACPVHNQLAGRVAMGLATVSFIAGMFLIALALVWG